MSDIDDRLDTAPREAIPRTDLWPGVAARLGSSPWPPLYRIAAAILLFMAGTLTGLLFGRRDHVAEGAARAATPFEAAVAVQQSGSAYLAALGRLRELEAKDPVARNQGYEAALVVLATAAEEVVGATDLPAADLTSEARQAQRLLAERTAAGSRVRE